MNAPRHCTSAAAATSGEAILSHVPAKDTVWGVVPTEDTVWGVVPSEDTVWS